MPVDNPDTQIQVNENPSSEVVARGLASLLGQPYIMIKVRTSASVHVLMSVCTGTSARLCSARCRLRPAFICRGPSQPVRRRGGWKCSTSWLVSSRTTSTHRIHSASSPLQYHTISCTPYTERLVKLSATSLKTVKVCNSPHFPAPPFHSPLSTTAPQAAPQDSRALCGATSLTPIGPLPPALWIRRLVVCRHSQQRAARVKSRDPS